MINREKEKELENHFIKWYKFVNKYPDTDDEEEENKRFMSQMFG